jgi:polysaccharide biosynthesis/export protein
MLFESLQILTNKAGYPMSEWKWFHTVKAVSLVFLVITSGCASQAKLSTGTYTPAVSAVVEQKAITLPDTDLQELPPADYLVGSGDVLYVNFPGKAEISDAEQSQPAYPQSPSTGQHTATAGQSSPKGYSVDSLGYVKLPLAGRVKVAGLSTVQIRERLNELLSRYIKEPDVEVEILQSKSQPLYLLGQFKASGVYYMDRPLTLLQGMALGGGTDTTANLRSARLIRNSRIVPTDIYEMLFKGDPRQNVWLKGGDTIYVPDNKLQNVFVLGAVKTPGPVPFTGAQMTLLQALSASGFGEMSYDPHIRIIRSLSTTRGELIVVNLKKILDGEAMPMMLLDGDIIFIPRSRIGDWNVALNEILPSLQALSAVLQPFVQLKYLLDVAK